jgi:hypothetical protein
MADEKPFVDVTMERIPVAAWRIFGEIAIWALERPMGTNPESAAMDLLGEFIAHVSNAEDDDRMKRLINAVTQPLDGKYTLVLRDLPQDGVNAVERKIKQVGWGDFASFCALIAESGADKTFKLYRNKSDEKAKANGEGTVQGEDVGETDKPASG